MRPGDQSTPMSPQVETSSSLLKRDTTFAEVVDLVPTVENTLRSVRGPRDVISRTKAPYSAMSPLTYETMHGVGYVRLDSGQRHVLLTHEGGQIREFQGWNRAWSTLIGTDSEAQINAVVRAPGPSEPTTEFVSVANGIIIIPQGQRAYFYDGYVCAPLGFDQPPAAPQANGPSSSSKSGQPSADPFMSGTNDLNYASDGLQGWAHSIHRAFKGGRLGTVSAPGQVPFAAALTEAGAGIRGYLLPGAYRYVTQYIDQWGNLSPVSGPSGEVTFDLQPATQTPHLLSGLPVTPEWTRVDDAKKRVMLTSVSKGPQGVVGRIIGRNKDTRNSGDVSFWEVPGNANAVVGALATLPDNVTEIWPDNIPDSWLTRTIQEVDPVPVFRTACMAFGMLWIGGLDDDPAAIMTSMPGRWGTFPAGSKKYPDPRGSQVTAVRAVPQGVLVFTRNSTFLYTVNDTGAGFKAQTISLTVGCVAPNSVVTMGNGQTVWLARDGFYTFDGSNVNFAWYAHATLAQQHNQAALPKAFAVVDQAGEYRCWVAVKGSALPNRCYTFNGSAWRWRTDMKARAAVACTDDDNLLVAVGQSVYDVEGAYVLDKGTYMEGAYLDTGWMGSLTGSYGRKTVRYVHVRLRECSRDDGKARTQVAGSRGNPVEENGLKLTVYRDYRAEPISEQKQTCWVDTTSGPQAAYWGITPAEDAVIRRARPFWVKFSVDVISAESYRLKLECDGAFDIVDIVVDSGQGTPSMGREY